MRISVILKFKRKASEEWGGGGEEGEGGRKKIMNQ